MQPELTNALSGLTYEMLGRFDDAVSKPIAGDQALGPTPGYWPPL